MVNTPTRQIQLDKPRTLRLDMRAALDFKKATGFSLMKDDLENLLDEEVSLHLLHACLRREDPALTFERLVDLCDYQRLTTGMELIAELIREFAPEGVVQGTEEGPTSSPLPQETPAAQPAS